MKNSGIFLLFIGAIWGLIAFNMDTTVEAGGGYIGGTYIPRQHVQNFGKMDERRNHLMVAGLFVIVGVMLFGFGSTGSFDSGAQKNNTRKCPYCAEAVKTEAKLCKYCGRDLPKLEALLSTSEGALIAAVRKGDIKGVRRLLDDGADINEKDSDGNTALSIAQARSDSLVVTLLVSRGARKPVA